MNLVDSSGWLEYLTDGPNAAFFETALSRTSELIVPTVCLYEVFKVVLRESDENAALQAVAALQRGIVADLTPKLAVSASKLSLHHSLPMADAIVLATAQAHGATLWTQDIHFKGIHGIKYFPKK